ncbi:MAG: O-antigen ligase family protein [Thermodesulfobacteriota bacterium]
MVEKMRTPELIAGMNWRERAVWLLFAATSLQLAFQWPLFRLVPGERTNLFSALLCFLTLVAAWLVGKKEARRLKSPEVLVSLALTILALLSSIFSLTPGPSVFRVFALLASGLGGFWCARLLLDDEVKFRWFRNLCLFSLTGILLLSFLGYLFWGKATRFFDPTIHSFTHIIFLLSFAPLALLSQPPRGGVLFGLLLLGLSFLVFCLSRDIYSPLVALGLVFWGAFWGRWRLKYFLLIFLVLLVGLGIFRHKIPWEKAARDQESVWYRAECLPLTLKIASQHPLFGIGLRSPRVKFLDDYQMQFPWVKKEKFAEALSRMVTCDNLFLTFLAGLGFPFVIIYSVVLLLLYLRLLFLTYRPPEKSPIPLLALLLPITAGLLSFLVFDTLLFPQLSWYFHILLGLIPSAQTRAPER